MITIRLRDEWLYDPSVPLGRAGGFGAVFLGTDLSGHEVAIKRLHVRLGDAGLRELRIAEELEGRDFGHVIPVFDSGIDTESAQYFVVMARAEKSLQDDLNKGPLSEVEATSVLMQIADGLVEIKDIVHRDLKPGNILFHHGAWKIADFGIARLVEAATSANTLKDCWSPQYAAPEQWRLERATNATDIYSFGCIAYALLMGHPPFVSGDLGERHQLEDPSSVSASPGMKQLVSLCLMKNPKTRPPIESVKRQLAAIRQSAVVNRSIALAGAAVAEEQARREAAAERKRTENQEREELARDAAKSLDAVLELLFEAITNAAPVAARVRRHEVVLGSGRLVVEIPFPVLPADAFPTWKKDIICGAVIRAVQQRSEYRGRSANFWFGDIDGSGELRWWEIAYFSWARDRVSEYEPFGIETKSGLQHADYAGGPIMHSVQLAAPPVPIDREHTDEFISKWADRLAAASRNALRPPSTLPER